MKPLTNLARRIYHASPATIVRAAQRAWRRGTGASGFAPAPEITEQFLRSDEYDRLMALHLPSDGTYDLHEAQNETRNFLSRHHTYRDRLGIFRWRGMQKHLELILEKVTQSGATVLDLGGAACPLGFGSKVVDHLASDAYGRPVDFHSLAEVVEPVDTIFTSHTLEHIEPLEAVIAEIFDTLKPAGYLLAHVPSYTCDRWWPGVHSHERYHDHVWCFGLRTDNPPAGVSKFAAIDEIIATHFKVDLAEYCGDDSIFVVARKVERNQ